MKVFTSILIYTISSATTAAAFVPSLSKRAAFESKTVDSTARVLHYPASTLNAKDSPVTDTPNSSASSTEKTAIEILADENGNPFQQAVYRFLAAGGDGGGEIGDRGEVYFFAQAVPIIGIALGGFPLVSTVLHAAVGPGLFAAGAVVLALTALDMGASLTPWPRPNGGGLVTTGLYSQVRHPMYAGLLSLLTGFSVWTDSVDRLLLVAFLWMILEVKSNYEEGALRDAYPEYTEYQKKVTSKFTPQVFLSLLADNNNNTKE